MAVISSKILNAGKSNTTKLLIADFANAFGYQGIGVGNESQWASETDIGIKGNESSYKPSNASYYLSANNSYVAQWNSSWIYNDLPSHEFSEVVICRGNNSFASEESLLRATYNTVVLGEGDSLVITIQVAVTEA